METFPASIEAQLDEAGFSGSEIIILRQLIDQKTMTVREVCAKTGKSPGVMDQAMKKLLKKRVVTRSMINDVPKYELHSVDILHKLMKDDMKQKQQLILRRFENFEAFISTIKKTKSTRPELEYFEGQEGMKKAYMEILERGKLFLIYGPSPLSFENDPLGEFRNRYFHECHRRDIFTRVITHDTPEGRKFQSRDPFEYRETILVDAIKYPFQFQKIVVGDTIACFNLDKEEACLMRYSDFAEGERVFFERIWHKKTQDEKEKRGEKNTHIIDVPAHTTRVLSDIRNFFFTKKSIFTLAACACFAGIVTAAIFWQMAYANLQKIREQVKSVAATGALQFETADLDQLHTKADITKPEYAKVIAQLNAIREQNKEVVYIYVLRPTTEKNVFEYVADADSLQPDVMSDTNQDGVLDAADENVVPGQKFTATDDVLLNYPKNLPAADKKPYSDQWGTFIGGMAPIYDKDGKINTLLGVDNWAKGMYAGMTISRIIFLFFTSFFLFVIIWLSIFDQYVFKKILSYIQEDHLSSHVLSFFFSRKSLLATLGMIVIATSLTAALYYNNASLALKRIQDKVLSVAATGALQFDPKDLDQLHTAADITKTEYAKIIYLLNAIRQSNDGVKYAYIMRPTNQDGIWEFIADADSLDPYAKKDLNGDGKVDDEDHLSPPGEIYNAKAFNAIGYKQVMQKPVVSDLSSDQWGQIISGWAPIKNSNGATVAIFGVDKFTSDINELTTESFKPISYFLAIFLVLIILRLAAFNRSLLKEIYELVHIRKFIIAISSAAIASLLITFGLYQYTQHITLQRIQDKVLAIATTAAPQFDANDINALQLEQDWKKPEWVKVVNVLKKIELENKNIVYVYIFRKSANNRQIMEFVSDSGSIDPYANIDSDPTNDVDGNGDGKIDGGPTGADYLTWPGQLYPNPPHETFDAYNGPTTNKNFYEDQWGRVISGYAPIKDQNENVVGILAVDMKSESQNILTDQVFAPIYVFLFFFMLFILFRLKGFSKSLLHQLLGIFKKRIVILAIVFLMTVGFGSAFAVYEYTLHILQEEMGARLMSIAATAAPEFSAADLAEIHIASDMKKDAYQRVFKKLNEIRKHNTNIQWAYIHRYTNQPDILEFIADADSNFYIPFEGSIDYNDDGQLNQADENVYPGLDTYDEVEYKNWNKGVPFFMKPYGSQWGVYISGYAPIRDKDGNIIAYLGLDMDVSNVYALAKKKLIFWE